MKLLSKRQYPGTLLIKGEEWRIAFVDRIEGKETVGMCDPSNRIIYIANGQSKEEMFATFIHECLHALEMEHDIKISHKAIYALEKAVFQFLTENF